MADDVQLVCFDLGGVLMRICDGWGHGCRVANVPPPSRKLAGSVRAQLAEIMALSDIGALDLQAFAQAAGPLLGADPAHVIAVSDAYLLGPYEGAADLLHELADRGVETACLSNTNASHWAMMTDPAGPHALPLDGLTHRFASHLLRVRKPDPAIYQHVEQATGAYGPGIVFFDDLAPNVEAAWQRGWRACRVDPTGDPVAQARSHLIDLGVL